MVTKIFKTTLHLPNRIQAICWVQFWAWIGRLEFFGTFKPMLREATGWFPFLFYSPTWVGEIYFRYSAPESVKQSIDKLGEIGRISSLSLIIFSLVTFSGSILLPWVVTSPDEEKDTFTPRPPPSLAKVVMALRKCKPDLLTAWLLSHLIFAAAMSLTPLVRSLHVATILVAACGMYVHLPL